MKKASVQQLPTKERLYAVFIKAGISEKKLYDFLLAPNSAFFFNILPLEIEEFVGGKRNRLDGDDAFGRETEILLYLFPELGDTEVRLAEYFV